MALPMSWPASSACLIWQRKYWEKYEGAVHRQCEQAGGYRRRADHGLPRGTQDVPSDERDAPESLYSSDPIWMGKTRSWGRM